MVDGIHYDLYSEVKECGLGWNYGENDIEIVDRFLEKYPFEPEMRFQLIMLVKKKNNMVRKKLLPTDPSDEEGIAIQMKCFSCRNTITFPKFTTDFTCSCKFSFRNPLGVIERECPFEYCEGKMKFVKGNKK
jgi:hypothetical protein